MIPGYILNSDVREHLVAAKETIVPEESDRYRKHVGHGFGHLPVLVESASAL